MKTCYVLHPGNITSIYDGQTHFVSAQDLAKLYGVSLRESIIFRERLHCNLEGPYVHLWPRADGNYSFEPTKFRNKTKRTTIKQMKETGWYDFVQWAINHKLDPSTINGSLLEEWFHHKAVLKLAGSIEVDTYRSERNSPKMMGLSKQVGRK